MPHDLEVAAAVDLRSVHQVVRDGLEEGDQHHGGEHAQHLGQDDAQVGVRHAGAGDHLVDGHHQHGHGHEHRGLNQHVDGALEGELQLGEGIRRTDGHADLQHGLGCGGHHGVEVVPAEGHHVKHLGEVVKLEAAGQPHQRVGQHFRAGLECGEDHPGEGEEHDQRKQQQEQEHRNVVMLDLIGGAGHITDPPSCPS